MDKEQLYVKTPLILSHEISLVNSSDSIRRDVYLKLDNCQVAGSFKTRGISHFILENHKQGTLKHVISSSGGNAGLAAAYSAYQLGIKSTIVSPKTVSPSIVEKLKSYNANVKIHGDVWDVANEEALRLNSLDKESLFVHPFDNPLIWQGHSSIIDEIKEQLGGDLIPDCIIVSVGGGGLLSGVIEGVIRNNWIDKGIKIIAVETEGADCFNKSVQANRLVTLDGITSIATTLGAKTCAPKLFEYYQQYKDIIESIVVTDKETVEVMNRFLDDHKFLVEPSCAASLVVAYNLNRYFTENRFRNVVVEVCGGSATTFEILSKYNEKFLK